MIANLSPRWRLLNGQSTVRVESTHILIQLVQHLQYCEPRQFCISLLDIACLVEGLE